MNNKSENKGIVYIARDIERALGIEPDQNYRIITNGSSYGKAVKKQFPDWVELIESKEGILDTLSLLKHGKERGLLSNKDIVVFKNNSQVETYAKENNIHLLNPISTLAEQVENKITQFAWLGDMAKKYLPSTDITKTADIVWNKSPFIIQWAHGHTGDSTVLISTKKELDEIKKAFPERQARISPFMKGPSFTVNMIVAKNAVLMGNISYQITGILPFTENRFSTVGNDWSLTHSLLDEKDINDIETICKEVGNKMHHSGWRGLFGVDLLKDEETDHIHLIEINARQPASTSYESELQAEYRQFGLNGISVFEAHLMALRDNVVEMPIIEINDGAQIVQRVTKQIKKVNTNVFDSLEAAGYTAIPYDNIDQNTDLLRIQSMKGIMEGHNKLNKRGKEIEHLLSI